MARKPVKVWVQAVAGRNLALQWICPATGRRRTESTGTTDASAAEELRAKKEYELRHGIHAEPSRATWEQFVDAYVDERMASRRPNTRYKARQVLTDFGRLANVKRVAEADARAVSRFAARLRDDGRKAVTIAGHLAYLRAAFRWAVRQGMLAAIPAVDMPRVSRRSHVRTISDPEWKHIINHAPPVWTAYLWTLWHTGMRRTEAAELRWDRGDGKAAWVDLAAGRIWIPAEAAKADKDDWLPIRKELLKLLKPLARPSGKCFPGLTADPSKVFAGICYRAGVESVTLHDIRRTFGTRLAPHVPAHVLKRLLRHASIETTLKFYIDADQGLADAIEKGV